MNDELPELWLKIDGYLTDTGDIESTWALMSPRPGVEEKLKELALTHRLIVYGTPMFSPRGQRAAQRWLHGNGLSPYIYWTAHEQEAPKGVKVRDKWESTTTADETKSSSPSATASNAGPADNRRTATSNKPSATN